MKPISDKVNLAVRRCKNKGKKITVAEARDSKYLDKSNRKAMNRNWSNQKANPALKTKAGNK